MHLQAFATAHDQSDDRIYVLKRIELIITRAVIQTIQARLLAELGLSYDKALVVEAYAEALDVFEKYDHFLSNEQRKRAIEILNAIADLISALNS